MCEHAMTFTQYTCISLLLACVALARPSGLEAADDVQQRQDERLKTGRFSWRASQPLVTPRDHAGDHCYAVKDPSIVRHNGRWHLFCTIRSEHRTHQIEYRSFVDWADADQAQPQLLDLNAGNPCAPQVFYFEPQKKWYLIYQVQDPSRTPSLQPAYSTTDNLSDPKSWSKPTLLFDKQPETVKMWIDFWVICDDQKAHLFFTSHAGWMWRSETRLDQFPAGWSKPEVVLRGDIFEASHTYRLQGQNRFLTLVEAQAGSRRYLKAFTAERLDGKWSPLAATMDQPLASRHNVDFDGSRWTDSISHGEFLRAGFDQHLEIDPRDLKILFQGTNSETLADKNYGTIPWKLGLLTLNLDTTQTSDSVFPYRHWTTQPPFFTAGAAGTFDEVSAKDPSIVRYDGKWHLFYTSKPNKSNKSFGDGVGYVAAETLAGLQTAKRHDLNAIVDDIVIAPQIFYFRPHRLWYLIAQTPNDRPSQLDPVYLTNPDIGDVDGWSKPKILKTNRKNSDAFWIDFWVICDSSKAHLFYTDHAGSMFRMETPIDRFPDGFAESSAQLAVAVQGRDKTGPWRLHEASHTYYVTDERKYLTLLEAVRPHPTKRNYWDSRNRFVFAMVADSLEGPWERVEDGQNDFIGIPKYVFDRDGSQTLDDQISHPELIRSGFDERLEVKGFRLQIMFQAFDAAQTPDNYDYDKLPWKLSIMKNY
jgi:hypothetical protein